MRNVKEKRITGLLLIVFAVIAILAGAYRPQAAAAVAGDFRLWRQNDERWGNNPIGGSTVRQSGCYMTSIAMVAVASGARDTESFDPGVFSKDLNDIHAFNQWGGLSSWSSVSKVVEEISISSYNLEFTSKDQGGKAAEIKALLDAGSYVICNVGGHWVYIDGVIGDDVYMADPAKDEILLFEAYKNENITVYQTLKGKEPYSGFTPLYDVSAEEAVTTTAVHSEGATVTTQTATTTTSAKSGSTTASASADPKSATSTMVSTTAKATTKAAPAVYKTGEYYCTESKAAVYSEPNEKGASDISVENGNIVRVLSVSGSFGEVRIGGRKGWINLEYFGFAEERELSVGDINNDGVSDEYDLAIINEYLSSSGRLPEGVSVLTGSETAAADINGDGNVDNTDVLIFLMRVCS